MRTRPHRVANERPTGLAGWLYADIFLALMVVGLATVSVRGGQAASAPPESTTTTTTTTVAPEPEQPATTSTTTPPDLLPRFLGEAEEVTYSRADVEGGLLKKHVDEIIRENGWPRNAVVVVVQVVGGYDKAKGKTSKDGTYAARKFYEEYIRPNDQVHFKSTSAIYGSDPDLRDAYKIRFFFAYLGE